MSIKIDFDACIGCGTCAENCTFGALVFDGEKPVYNVEKCTSCSLCVDNCPAKAISVDVQQDEKEDIFRDYRGVWVFAEQRYGELEMVSLELLGEGLKLAHSLNTSLTMVLLGHTNIDHLAEDLIYYGADRVLVLDHELLDVYTTDGYTTAIYDQIMKQKPEILLIGATMIGRDLGPRLAARLKTGLTADCTHLGIDAETRNFLQTRPAFGGNLMATIICPNNRPQMATVRPGTMAKAEYQPHPTGVIEHAEVKLFPKDIRTSVESVLNSVREGIAIEDAKIVVAIGRGLRSSKDLVMIEKLARLLKAGIAVTRPVVEAGWYPVSHQVGLTGKTIRPNLYIAIGISGASQHIVGMQDSRCIVAINKDPEADIFKYCHYGIVGDLYDIVPEMIRVLEKQRELVPID